MNVDLKRTWAIFRKELIHIRRDYQSLIQIILLPIMLLILYGYALTFDIRNVPTAVYDLEKSQISRDFLREFHGSRYFDLRYWVDDYQAIRNLMSEREIRLALVIPFDFSRSIKSGGTAKVQAIIDGTDANTANIVQGYVLAVAQSFNQNILIERLNLLGVSKATIPVEARMRFWFNEDLESKNFIIPGLIVVIMTMVGALLTALTIVREVERGSMESLLATPLRKTELIIGKLGPYFLLGLIDLAIAVAMGHFLFQVPLKGSIILYVVLSSVFLMVMLGMGMLISILSENQLQAYQMATLITFLPAFLLSGFVFAIPLMPLFLQIASYLVPARYLVTICKGIYLKGVGLKFLWPSALMLVFFAVFFLALAIRKFRHKIG
uniref:ABC transporter permease n=1 Tax=Desulfobacca acetoxidans TaxID=60893 RepID=A0A7V6DNZ6_9BACT